MANYAIVGANGRNVDPADFETDAIITAIEGMDEGTAIGAISNLLAMRPNLTARANAISPRVANLIRRTGSMGAAPALGAAARAAAPQLVEVGPGPVGLASIPFNSNGVVNPGAIATIVVQPQSIFKVYKLVIDDVVRPFFMIQAFTIGTVPLFDAPGLMAGTLFTPDALPNLKKITANPGISVTLIVQNRDGAAHAFSAGVYGEAAPTQCG